MNCKYCQWCGSTLEFISGDKFTCTGCGKTHYVCPKTSAGSFIITGKGRDKQILLSVRGRTPRKGMLDVVGGFLDSHESLEEAVVREFFEETGVGPEQLNELKYVGNDTSLYEWQGDSYPVSSVYFVTEIQDSSILKPNDDVAEIKAFNKDELKREDFAWPRVYDLALKAWDMLP